MSHHDPHPSQQHRHRPSFVWLLSALSWLSLPFSVVLLLFQPGFFLSFYQMQQAFPPAMY